jgi:hypothetical protein
MDFEMVAEGPSGPNLITAFLTHSPINGFQSGFKTAQDVLAELSPSSTRSLVMRRNSDWLAAGKVAAEIRGSGQCRLE